MAHYESIWPHYKFLLDPNEPLVVVGDLNMDLKSSEGNDLKDFLINNEMKNYVNVHTRIARTFYKKKQKYVESKTLIDVILQNQDKVIDTAVFGCPFSGHSFVIAALDFSSPKKKNSY